MHQDKCGPGKLFHFSGVCFTSPWVFSQLLHSFWNQSCLPGMGLTFESITTCLHQNPQGNAEDDTGKMKESRPPAYFMRSLPVQRHSKAERVSHITMSKSLYDSLQFGKERTKENVKYSCFLDGEDMQMTKSTTDPCSHTVLCCSHLMQEILKLHCTFLQHKIYIVSHQIKKQNLSFQPNGMAKL